MKNTYVAGAGVVVVAIGLFYLFGGGLADSNGAVKNLTRDSAAKQILDALNSEQNVFMRAQSIFERENGNYDMSFYGPEIEKLSEAGYIEIINPLDTSAGFRTYEVRFTEKAAPFIRDSDRSEDGKFLVVEKASKVEVGGITAPSEKNGKRQSVVQYTPTYEPTPLGEQIAEKLPKNKREIQNAVFILYDDGWRIDPYSL